MDVRQRQDNQAPERDALYRRVADEMAPALARLAEGFEADVHAREDLLQDIHLRIWKSLERFDGAGNLRAWAFRVAHNTAADHVARAVRRRPTRPSDTGDVEGIEPGPGPASMTETSARAARLMTSIRSLPPLDRHLILLYLEGEPPRSIATLTGLSAGAVSVRIHRARAALTRDVQKGEDV